MAVLARIVGSCVIFTGTASASTPIEILQHAYPALYSLYQTYPGYHGTFRDYANRQGFQHPVENLATVVHELVHVDSAAHQGFFINGVYYEPYLRRDAWPTLTNSQVQSYLSAPERNSAVYQFYVINTPKNNLGNVVDEINAYGHVLPFVCRNEAELSGKQISSLIGFLNLSEGYLRTLRTLQPVEYQRLVNQKEARGVFLLVVQRAWSALRECGVAEEKVPSQEAISFRASRAPSLRE